MLRRSIDLYHTLYAIWREKKRSKNCVHCGSMNRVKPFECFWFLWHMLYSFHITHPMFWDFLKIISIIYIIRDLHSIHTEIFGVKIRFVVIEHGHLGDTRWANCIAKYGCESSLSPKMPLTLNSYTIIRRIIATSKRWTALLVIRVNREKHMMHAFCAAINYCVAHVQPFI